MIRLFALFLALVVTGVDAAPVSMVVGERHESGSRVLLTSAPHSIALPDHWFGLLTEGGVFLMVSESEPGMVMLMESHSHPGALVEELRAPLPFDEGLTLEPLSVVQKGEEIEGRYRLTVSDQPIVGILRTRVLATGGSVVVLHVGPESDEGASLGLINAIINSIQHHSEAELNQLGKSSWSSRLGGQQLEYYRSGDGVADQQMVALCSDGTYIQSDGHSGYYSTPGVASFSASGSGQERGYWRVVGNHLVVEASDGMVSYQLGWSEGELYLDGERWFIRPNTLCQ